MEELRLLGITPTEIPLERPNMRRAIEENTSFAKIYILQAAVNCDGQYAGLEAAAYGMKRNGIGGVEVIQLLKFNKYPHHQEWDAELFGSQLTRLQHLYSEAPQNPEFSMQLGDFPPRYVERIGPHEYHLEFLELGEADRKSITNGIRYIMDARERTRNKLRDLLDDTNS